MGSLARTKHTQRDERQKRHTGRAKHELDGKHRGIVIFGSKAAKALSTAPSKGATFAGYLT
jgi:hypothetical protein